MKASLAKRSRFVSVFISFTLLLGVFQTLPVVFPKLAAENAAASDTTTPACPVINGTAGTLSGSNPIRCTYSNVPNNTNQSENTPIGAYVTATLSGGAGGGGGSDGGATGKAGGAGATITASFTVTTSGLFFCIGNGGGGGVASASGNGAGSAGTNPCDSAENGGAGGPAGKFGSSGGGGGGGAATYIANSSGTRLVVAGGGGGGAGGSNALSDYGTNTAGNTHGGGGSGSRTGGTGGSTSGTAQYVDDLPGGGGGGGGVVGGSGGAALAGRAGTDPREGYAQGGNYGTSTVSATPSAGGGGSAGANQSGGTGAAGSVSFYYEGPSVARPTLNSMSPVVGTPLVATAGSVTTNNTGSVATSWQWQIQTGCTGGLSSISGATSSSYTPVASDVGSCFAVRQTSYDATGAALGVSTALMSTTSAVVNGTQAALSISASTTSAAYNGTAYSATPNFSTSGGTGSGAVTYAIESGGTAGTCTLSNSSASATLTGTQPGTCLISATKASADGYNSVKTTTNLTFTFSKASQATLNISATTTSANYNGTAFSVTPSFSSSGGSGTGAVTYSINSGGTASSCSLSSSAANAVLTATSAGTCFVIAGKAADSNYQQAISANLVITFSATVPGTISNLEAQAAQNQQVSLSWTAPTNTGGSAITDYKVTYTYCTPAGPGTVTCNGTETEFAHAASASTSIVVTGLTNGYIYYFTVYAKNAIGYGAGFGPSNGIRPSNVAGIPTGISATAGNTQATVTWTAPSSDGGADITDYTIQYSSNGGGTWSTFAHTASANTSATVTGLTNGTTYVFRVAAVNTSGTGTATSASTGVVPFSTLSKASNPAITATSGSTTSLTVTFTADPGAASTTLKLYSAATGGTLVATKTSATSPWTFTGLTANTTYWVTATSIGDGNGLITGDESDRVSGTTYSVAGQATFTVNTNVGGDTSTSIYRTSGQSVTFSVTAASPDGGTLTYQWRKLVSSVYQDIVGATSNTLTISNLTTSDATSYFVRVTNTKNGTSADIASSTRSLNVAAALSLTTPTSGLTGNLSAAFTTLTLTASGGLRNSDTTCSITTGALPGGLAINQSGFNCQISGTPTATGSFAVVATITDSNGATASTSSFTIVISDIAPGQPTITGWTTTSTSISLSFLAGSNSGSPITKYQYSTDNGSTWQDASGTTSPLAISSLTIYTTYLVKIRAFNSVAGTATGASSITTSDIQPAAPTITGITPTSSSLSVAFTAGSNSGTAITKYQYSTDGGSTWADRTDSGTTASPLVITKLSSNTATSLSVNTSYNVKIRAFNSSAGLFSAQVTSSTSNIVPSAPTSVTGTRADSSVVVSWTVPASNGGSSITSYTATSSPGSFTCNVTGASSTSCTVTGLTNGTAYTFTVVATNSAGNSLASTASASVTPATNAGAPTSVSATSNANTQSVITWTAPVSNGGSAITNYLIEYSSDAGSSWTAVTRTASTSTSYTLTGLVNGTGYIFRIAAVNSIGTGSYSTNSATATPSTTPGTPTNVTSTDFVYNASNNGTILVSWNAPTNNGGAAITDYVIEYSISNNGVWNAISHTASTATSLTVTGISALPATYNFRISAKNASGTGSVSTASPGMVLKKPATPSGSAVNGSKTSLNITFTSLNPINTSVYLYTSSSGGSPVASSIANTGSTATLTGLTEGTTYYAAIASTKSAYYTDSPESDRFAITTNAAPQAPTITTQPISTNVTNGTSYTLTVAATSPDGGTISYQWKRNGTNVGTGTTNSSSLAIGTYNFTVDVTNTKNGLTTVLTSNTAVVGVYSSVTLTNLSSGQIITGTYGTAFSYQLGASGGLAPYTYSYGGYNSSYTLPPGLTLDPSTGLISGTPTTVGTYGNLAGTVNDSIGSVNQIGWFTVDIAKATLATPSAPTVSATPSTLKSLTVSWTAVANAGSYQVKLYSGATNVSNKLVTSATSTTFSSSEYSSMADATTYSVKIVAVPSNTTNYSNSAESSSTSATTNAQTGLTPTFGSVTRTAAGFTFTISNYSASYSWAASASTGSASVSGSTVTVTGLSANTSSTITVTSSRTGYTSVSADKVGTSLIASSVSVALAGSATTATVGTAVVLTATADQAGTVTFKQGSTSICSSVAISASPFTATCSWTPSAAGTVSVTADFSPTASTSYATSTSTAVSVVVGKGTLALPTGISVTATAGSTSQIVITLTANSNATNTYVYEYADATTTTATRSYGVLNGTTYKENLTAGTTYYYEFVSGGDNVNWNSSASSIRYSATTNVIYTVTYSLNGLTGHSISRSSDSYVTGATALALPSVSPARTGYTDLGWFDSASGGNKIGNAGASYTPTGSITLYYQWSPTTYTITYNAGTSGSGTALTQNFDVTAYPTLKTLSDVSSQFTRTGYSVTSWNTNTNGTGTTYALGATNYQSAANLTLYAIWTINSYTVTFDSQGGSAVTSGSFTYGGSVSSPTAPTYSGNVFLGWFTGSTGGTALTFPYTPGGTSAITLYAQWKANPTFTSIDVSYALKAGGQTRTITGTNLDLVTSMTVDGTTATISSKNATTIVFTTPSLLTGGSKAIVLTYPTAQTLSAGNITYYDVPTITNISTGSGFTNGGATITITGTALSSATAVKIGGVDAASFTVISDTSISFVTPVLLAGNRQISVTTLGGSANSAGSVSIAVSAPTITTQPSSVSKVVGESVTFTVVAAAPTDGGTLSYQWQKAGSNITGATSASYTFTTSTTADAANYTVIVKSTQNSVVSAGTTSSAAALTMTGQTQTITFTSTVPTGAKVAGSTYTVTATGGSSGNSVSFTSLTTTQCTIASAVVTFKAVGTCTIAANQTGNTTYAAATQATQDITVAKGDPNLGALTISNGTFGSTVTSGITDPTKGTLAGTFAYTSSNAAVATVSGSTLTVTGAGTSTITATFTPSDTTNYNTATVSGTFTVNKGTLSTPAAPINLSATAGTLKSINATFNAVSGASSYTIQIISAADNTTVVATITGITSTTPTLADSALADGTSYKLKLKAVGGANYNDSALSSLSTAVTTTSSYTITYSANSADSGTVPASGLYITGASGTLVSANTGSLARVGFTFAGWNTAANGSGTDYAATGSATYSNTANVIMYAKWTALVPTITSFVSTTLGTTSTPYGDTVTITGTNFLGATSVKIGTTSVSVFNIVSATSITFTSNRSCCSVGKVSVTTPGGTGTSTADLTPLPQVPVITSQPADASKAVGESVTFTVVASTPADGGTLSYQWKKGTATIAGATSASYTFTTSSLADAANYWVIVTSTISTNTSTANSNNAVLTMAKGSQATLTITSTTGTYDTPLTLTYSGGSTSGAVTFSTATAGCSITSGVLTTTSAKTCVVSATMSGNTDYNDVTSSNTDVVIGKASQATLSFSFNSASAIGCNTGLPCSAFNQGTNTNPINIPNTTSGSGTGQVTITVRDGTATGCYLSNSNNGTLSTSFGPKTLTYNFTSWGTPTVTGDRLWPYWQASTDGTCIFTATKAGDSNYLSATSADVTFTFSKLTPSTAGFTTQASSTSFELGNSVTLTGYSIQNLSGSGTYTFKDVNSNVLCVASTLTHANSATTGSCTWTPSSAATYSVKVYFSGDTYWNLVTQTSGTSITVNKTSQSISFIAPTNKTYGDTAFTISASATSNLTVTFASSTSTVCTVSGSTVTILTAGTCTLTANQSGDATYAAATQVSQSITVDQATQSALSISATTSSAAYTGSAYTATPTFSTSGGSGSGAVTYSIVSGGSASSCALSSSASNATLTASSTGTCFIAATKAASTNYLAATSANLTFTFTASAQTISFTQPADKTYGDADFTLTASATSTLSITFASSTTSVCTVSGNTVSIVTAGTCTLTADQSGNSSFAAASTVTKSFTVSKKAQATLNIAAVSSSEISSGTAYSANPALSTSGGSGTGSVTYAVVSGGSATSCVLSSSAANATLTASSSGTCLIAATLAADTNYLAATSSNLTFTFTKKAQTITFATLSSKVFGSGTFTVSATSDAGLTPSFTSGSLSTCTVSGTTVTLVAAGTCTINADQIGDTYYAAASQVQRSFTISLGTQATLNIAATSSSAAFNGSLYAANPAFSTSGGSGSGAVTYAIVTGSTATCTLSSSAADATLTATGNGTCFIAATKATDSNYNSVTSANFTFTFTKATLATPADPTVTAAATSATELSVNWVAVTNATSYTVYWYNSTGSTLVGSNTPGLITTYAITGLTENTTYQVSVKANGTGNYLNSSESNKISATTKPRPVAPSVSVVYQVGSGATSTITSGNVVIDITQGQTFTATVTSSTTDGGSIVMTRAPVKNGSPASGSNSGSATSFSVGAVIDNTYNVGSPTFHGSSCPSSSGGSIICVAARNTLNGVVLYSSYIGLGLNVFAPLTATVPVGQTGTVGTAVSSFTPSVSGGKANYTYQRVLGLMPPGLSLDVNTGAVTGTPTTSGVYSIVIRVTEANGTSIDVTIDYTITALTQTITFSQLADKTYGDSNFSISATTSSTLSASFTSATSSVCTVTGSTVQILTAGTCTLNANQVGDTAYSAATQVQQSFVVNKANQTTLNITSTLSSAAYTGTLFTAVPTFANNGGSGNGAVTYAVVSGGTAQVCALSSNAANATLTATSVGTCLIAATKATSTNYLSATSANLTFTFTATSQTITFSQPVSAVYGVTPAALSATSTSGLAITFTSATLSICTVSGTTVTLLTSGTCTINADQAGDSNYASATQVARSFTVAKANPVLSTLSNVSKTYGDSAFSITDPTVTGSLAGTFTYSSGTTAVATVSGSSVTPLIFGSSVITALFTPTDSDKYNTATTTFTLSVAARTLAQPNAPNATATAGTLKSIAVTWTAVTNAVAYTLKIYAADGTTLLQTVSGLSGTSKTLTATEFSTIADNLGYKIGLIATGDTNNADSIISTLSTLVTTNKTYVISYNANSSTGGTTSTSGSWITGATATAIAANSGTLVRSGYTFAGWNTLANGTGTDYAATGSATYSTTADLTLYAKWTANGLTITYKSDYQSGPADITESKTADTTFTLRGNTFTRPGYNFSGWALSSGGLIAKSDSATASVLVDTSYYAGWTAIDYTVAYNGNSNTGGAVPTDSTNYNIGGSITVKANSGLLTRTGYSFVGWTDNSGNTGTVYSTSSANTTYSVGTSSVTFYAKWSKNTYFVSYDSQGGSSVVSSTYQIGDTVTLPAGPTKTGYTFAGWFAAATGGTTLGSTYAPSGVGNITLYSQWTPIAYRVYYSSNNGNSGTVPSDATNYNITNVVTVVGNTANVGRTGYTWAGWNTAADGSGTTYQAAATLTMGSADVTLYAKWTAINYTITYNGNGFTSGTVPTDTNNYNIGGTISIAGSNGLARTGYTFLGWTVAADGTGTVMTSGYGLTVGSSDVTVYAKWSANTYTITYLANGASGSPSATSATYTTDGTTVTFPTVGTMQKAGHSFSGWATSSNGPPLTSPYTTVSDVTLVAVWTAINYTISYNSNGGSTTPTQSALPMGQSFALASGITKPNGPNNEVYAFVGWSDGTSTWQPGSSYLVKTANLSFAAIWVQVFEVNYLLNGASSTQPSNQLKNDGDVITLAAAPTRAGYEFQGWMDQSGQTFAASASYTVGILHYTLNAVWAAINYTITYDAAGGSVTPQQSAKNVGQTFYLANAISRVGYTFNGWSDGSQTLGAGSQVLVGTSNLSYTAQWTANVYTVSYDFNGGTGSSIANASYTYGSSAITLPLVGDRVRTNYTFGGWSTTASGTSVGLTYTPSISTTLYAVWTLNQYVITYNGNAANVSNSSATYTAGSSALTLPTITRAGFVFNGWYSSSTGGTLIGLSGANFVPTSTRSIYAKWTQLSLSGVDANDLSFISSTTANASIGVTSTFTTSSSSASVSIPAGALPDGTVISYHLLASNANRTVALPAGTNYVLSLVVSWVAPDGSVPSTASGKPIAMTVSSSSIKKGASVYAIAGSSVQFLGVATQDGSVLVNITDDPEVAIVKTKPSAPLNVSGSVSNGVGTVTWQEPLSSGGSDILGYEVALSGVQTTCITSALTCSFTGLVAGTTYTVSVRAFNAIDYSVAGSGAGSGAFTLSVPAPPAPTPVPAVPAPIQVVNPKPVPMVIPTLTSLTFVENSTKDGGKLVWTGTNIESVLFTGDSTTYPVPYNYGAFTITWNGSLVNMIPGVTYKMKLEVRSINGGSDSRTIEYIIAKPVEDTSSADAALKIAKELAEAQAKAEAQAQADKVASEAKAAAEQKAAEAKAAAEAANAAALKAAQQLADAKARAEAELKAKQAKAAEDARIAEELRKAKEKAEAELKLAAEKKALEDAQAAAALAAKKIIPEITLYSISSKLTLSAYDKAYLNKYISTLKSKATVTCIGYYYVKNTTLAKAKARALVQATAICKMIKKAKPTIITKIAIYSSSKAPKAAQGAKWVAISYRVDSFKSK